MLTVGLHCRRRAGASELDRLLFALVDQETVGTLAPLYGVTAGLRAAILPQRCDRQGASPRTLWILRSTSVCSPSGPPCSPYRRATSATSSPPSGCSRWASPVGQFTLATNDNDILARFFQTGVYRRGTVHHTINPSMDIQVASNLERYLWLRFGRDPERVRGFMSDFADTEEASIGDGAPVDAGIVAVAVDMDETRGGAVSRTLSDNE